MLHEKICNNDFQRNTVLHLYISLTILWKWRNDRRSERNLCICVKKPEKKYRASTGFEPVTSRLPVRCSTNWAMKPLTLGAGQLWVQMFPWKKWVLMIYEINHIWTAEMKWQWIISLHADFRLYTLAFSTDDVNVCFRSNHSVTSSLDCGRREKFPFVVDWIVYFKGVAMGTIHHATYVRWTKCFNIAQCYTFGVSLTASSIKSSVFWKNSSNCSFTVPVIFSRGAIGLNIWEKARSPNGNPFKFVTRWTSEPPSPSLSLEYNFTVWSLPSNIVLSNCNKMSE